MQGELKDLKAKEQPLRQQMQEKNKTYTRCLGVLGRLAIRLLFGGMVDRSSTEIIIS